MHIKELEIGHHFGIRYLSNCADERSIKLVLSAVIAALTLSTRAIWRDTVKFWCTSYEVDSSYVNTTGHNDEGASSEIDKFLPSSKLAHCLNDVIKV